MGHNGTDRHDCAEAQALRTLLALHEVALGTMSHALCMYDANHRVVLFNQCFIEIFGLSPAVVRRGMTMHELFAHGARCMKSPESMAQASWERRLRKFAAGKPFEHRYGLPGNVVIVSYFRPMPDGGWVVISEDVSAQQRMQQELRLQFERMNEALRNMAHGLSMFDADERLIVCNAQYLQMYDLDPDVVRPGITHREVLAHSVERGNRAREAADRIYSERMDTIRKGGTLSLRLSTHRGTIIEATSRRMPNGGWITISEDVTARLRTEEALREQNLRFDAALTNMAQGLSMFDANQRLTVCNDQYLKVFGMDPEVVKPGITLRDALKHCVDRGVFVNNDLDALLAHRLEALASKQTRVFQFDLAGGRTVSSTLCPMPNGGWVCTFEDITERRSAEAERIAALAELSEQHRRFDAALNNMAHGLLMVGRDRRVIVHNPRFLELFGLSADMMTPGVSMRDVMAHSVAVGNHRDAKADALYEDYMAQLSAGVTSISRHLASGRIIHIMHRPMADGGWVAIYEDVTEQRKAEEKIAYMARHDALTGLPNRVLFHDKMAEGLERVATRGSHLAILCLDLDHFKTVNDTLGHPIGDRLLSTVAQRLIRVLGPNDTIARLGGDEFAILQEGLQPQSAQGLAQRILDVVSHPVVIDGHEINSSVTIGVALAPKHAADSDHLMKCADLALYRAKAEGRASFRFFEVDMDLRLQERRGLELDLRKALAAGEFSLLYQPQVRARDGRLNGMEALLRWTHALRGSVPPAEFIPIAEETGLIIPLGEWVLRTACAEAAQWPADIRVAVNLSPVQFKGRGLVGTVARALASTGLPAHRLELEITEDVLLLDDDATIATLHQLRALGVRISMDDFGTGYSSLSYLRSFPFDKIKIDRSFITDLAPGSDSGAIIRAIASLGKSLGIETTAEGVETAEQLDLVRHNGCTEVQGFYFSPPRPATEVLEQFGKRGHRAVA